MYQEKQLKTIFRISLISTVALAISLSSGCSWLPDGDQLFVSEHDYSQAQLSKELEIPEELGKANIQDQYLVPELSDETKGIVYGVDANILAPMQVLTLGNKIRVNRDDEYSSVFVMQSVNDLWSSVERFIAEKNIQLEKKEPGVATITTDWVTIEDDAFWSGDILAWRSRYNFILGSTNNPAENTLTVELIESQEKVSKSGEWVTVHDSGRIEKEMLNSFLGFMYVEDITKSRQLVNESGLGGITVKLGVDNDGNPALISTTNFERVWTRIPIAMKMLKVIVEDKDRTQGLYFIKFTEESFFDSLSFWSSEDANSLILPDETYRIQITQLADRVSMTIIDNDNKSITEEALTKNFPAISRAFMARVL